MKIFSACLIVFLITIIIVGIVKLHELPGKIAASKNHPQVEAIKICSLLGLIIFPFWMFALLWAYMKPVFTPVPTNNPEETDSSEQDKAEVNIADGAQA